ncbi:MAG: acetyl-CoA hydrolase/transferase C-terminal domain-containing protein [Pseudomonadota bacterium]
MEEYRSKLKSAQEASKLVKSGHQIYYSGNAATPYPVLRALVERKDELKDVRLNHVLLIGDDPFGDPSLGGHFRHNSFFVGSADRKSVNEGRADYVPVFLFQIPRLFQERLVPLDVTIVQTSPPDEHGFLSLGAETLASKSAVENAKIVIVLVNDQMPRILGDCFFHISQATAIVEDSFPLIELPRRPVSEIEQKIAGFIAPLIEDGSTLQLGIGGIPDAVLNLLDGKRDLGIHTEMVSDGVMETIEKGIITGRKKTIHQGKAVLTFALGTKHLYDYLDNNPLFEAHPSDYTNNPYIVAQHEKMVAINSALEVDLTGQVCSDSIGTYIYSGFGGQVDFIRGAAQSKGGKPIIAVQATAKKGTMSRIVSVLTPGAGVVTSRADVHYVVTEFGVAYLFGKNIRKRAEALISVAHPDFRGELEAAARERKLIT